MVLWGLLAALLATLVLLTITPAVWPTRDGRGEKMRDSMTVLEHGGPLLLGRHGPRGPFYAVDFGDDDGAYVYVPLLSRLFGVADPSRMLRYLYVALVALSIAVYPLIFYRLTRSVLAALVAPWALLVCILSMGFVDIYWIGAWGALTLLPLIFLLARDWSRFGFLALVGIALSAGWLSSIRSYSGLGIFLAAALVLVLRRWRWWRLLPALATLAIVYMSINTFVFSAVRADRDHWLGRAAAKTLDVTSAHTLWHTVYAGLGYLPNSYGLRFLDGVPLAVVEREAPGTLFLSGRYETVVREAYLRFLRDHPGEAIRQYAAKGLVTIADVTPWSLIVLLTLPAVLLLGPDRRVTRRWMLLMAPAVVVAFLPVMAALPELSYEQGLYGAVGLVGVMGVCLLLARVEASVRERGVAAMLAGTHLSWGALAHSRAPCCRAARMSILALGLLIALAFGGYFVRRDANRWHNNSSSGVLMEYLG